MKRLQPLICLLTLLAACEKSIEFDGPVTEPMLVINAVVQSDTTLEVQVTESRFFLVSQNTFNRVRNATVALFVNGSFRENCPHLGDGRYVSSYRFAEGDLIRLSVSSPGFQPVSAETHLPHRPLIERIDTSVTITDAYPTTNGYYDDRGQFMDLDTVGWTIHSQITVTLTFKDNEHQADYYRLVVKRKRNYGGDTFYEQAMFTKDDIVFGETGTDMEDLIDVGNINYYGTFTDELINGRSYPLTFSVYEWFHISHEDYLNGRLTNDDGQDDEPYLVELQALDRNYYLYLVTTSAYDPYNPFAEPVQIHTNVENGIGILGGYAGSSVRIQLSF